MNRIKVLIADDHTIVRIGLKALFADEADIEVVGEAKNGVEAVKVALETHPDVVIMDLQMPKKDGVEATRELAEKLPSAAIAILTTYGTSDGIAHALQSGAKGAMLKTADDARLVSSIRKIAAGEKYVSPDIRKLLVENPPVPELSARQREILQSLMTGLTNKEIAQQLGIRRDSVEDHINTLFAKLGVTNRTEAVAIALRKHLLKI